MTMTTTPLLVHGEVKWITMVIVGSCIWQEFKDNKQTDSDSFKYSVDGDKITFTWSDEVYTSTFSISGNRLTIKDNEDSETYTKQ